MKIVFDIGGTMMRVAAIREDKLAHIIKIPTPYDPDEGLEKIITTIHKILGGEKIESITGGIAGTLTEDGRIFHSPNLPEWDDYAFGAALRKDVCENVTIYNDAALAGLGEAIFGAGKDATIVAYLGIGTGLGGAKIVNKKIEANASGFEPGQAIIDTMNKKTFEQQVAGHALAILYGKPATEFDRTVFIKQTPMLAAGIYNTILLWSPDVVILGGSLVNEQNGYHLADVQAEIAKLPNIFEHMPEIHSSALHDESGLWGALAIAEKK